MQREKLKHLNPNLDERECYRIRTSLHHFIILKKIQKIHIEALEIFSNGNENNLLHLSMKTERFCRLQHNLISMGKRPVLNWNYLSPIVQDIRLHTSSNVTYRMCHVQQQPNLVTVQQATLIHQCSRNYVSLFKLTMLFIHKFVKK